MMNERYSFYEKGAFISLKGRLGHDLEVKNYDNSRLVKLNIAVDAGSKKENDEWQTVTNWYSFNVWDKGGNSKLLLDNIENPPSEKLVFQKGNLVKVYGTVQQNLRIYEDKPYIDYTFIDFLNLFKVFNNSLQQNLEQNNSVGY